MSSSVGSIYTYPGSYRAIRCLAVAAYNDLKVDTPAFEFGSTNKTPEYLAKFPSGKVPTFESADKSLKLSQTAAISWYLASLNDSTGLLGKSPADAALIQQWVMFAETDIFFPVSQPAYMNLGFMQPIKPASDAAFPALERALNALESVLKSRTFLVGERITLADITVASILRFAYLHVIDASMRAKYPHTLRHYKSIAHNHVISPIFGDIQYLESYKFSPPKKEKKEEKKEQPKEKKEEKPKEEAAPAPAPAEKPKNPLDLLPKSSFNLEAWKRAYMNLDTRGTDPAKHSLAYFYANFVPEDYTVVKFTFKWNEELKATFMSNNQIGGFFTRLEASRKYMMGVGLVQNDTKAGGVEGASEIDGVFICRGEDYLSLIKAAPDWESYAYSPLDLNNADDKAFFEGVMAWDLVSNGKECVDGKILK